MSRILYHIRCNIDPTWTHCLINLLNFSCVYFSLSACEWNLCFPLYNVNDLRCFVVTFDLFRYFWWEVIFAWIRYFRGNLRSHSVIEIVTSTPVFIHSAKHHGALLKIHAFRASLKSEKRCDVSSYVMRKNWEKWSFVFCIFDAFHEFFKISNFCT